MAATDYTLGDQDYLELDALKDAIGISLSVTTHDQALQAIIKAVSRMLDEYSGREWFYGSRTERVAPRFGNYLLLRNRPVISITSITNIVDSSTILAANIDIEDPKTGQVFIDAPLYVAGARNTGLVGGINDKWQRKNYSVVYESGYETPTQSGTGADPFPFHIRQSLLEVAAHMFLAQGQNLSVKREHLLEAAYWYDHSNAADLMQKKLSRYGILRQA